MNASQEKFTLLRENETLLKANKSLTQEKDTLSKNKDLADAQIGALTKSLEAMQKDLKDKENLVVFFLLLTDAVKQFSSFQNYDILIFNFQVRVLKQSLELERKELNDCRAEITSLKMHIEESRSGNNLVVNNANNVQSQSSEKYEEEIKKLQMEVERLKEINIRAPENGNLVSSENEILQTDDKVIEIHEDRGAISDPVDLGLGVVCNEDAQSPVVQTLNEDAQSPVIQTLNEYADKHEDTLPELFNPAITNSAFGNVNNVSEQNVGQQPVDSRLLVKSDIVNDEAISEKTASPFYSWLEEILKHHYFLVSSFIRIW